MHALTMYALSMRDPATRTPDNKTGQLILSEAGLMGLLKEFLQEYTADYVEVLNSATNSVLHVGQDWIREDGTFLSGYIEYGHYGVPGKLVNVKTKEKHRKSKDDSDIYHLYFLFYLPKGKKKGVALFHKMQNVGVKSVIDSEFNKRFLKKKRITNKLRIKPITRSNAAKDFLAKLEVKKLVMERFKNKELFGDVFNDLPDDVSVDVVVRAPRGGLLGHLSEFSASRKDAKYSQNVVLAKDLCGTVKSEIKVDGNYRMTELSSEGAESRVILTEEDVEMEDNFPKFPSINEFAKNLAITLANEMD